MKWKTRIEKLVFLFNFLPRETGSSYFFFTAFVFIFEP